MGDPKGQVLPDFPLFCVRVRRALVALALVVAALVSDGSLRAGPVAAAYPTPNVEIDGHGFGHGRGMGQYGALGYALNFGWTHSQILAHFYSNTTAGDIGNPEITVILRAFDRVDTVVTQERGHMTTNAAGGTFSALRVRRTGVNTFRTESAPECAGPWTLIRESQAGPVIIQPQIRTEEREEMLQMCEPNGTRRWLRGDIRAVEGLDATQRTVNALDMQGYLRGSVPRESPASWGSLGGGAGMNALRAQAVAARSYAWAENRAPYAKTCDTTECQVYGGRAVQTSGGFADLEHPLTDAAVAETAGQVRLLNGVAARTEYSSSTGGYTAGGTFPAVVDEGDAIASNPNHSWHASIPVGQVQSAFPQVGTLNAVVVTRRNGLGDFGGRALEVRVEGSSGTATVTGPQFQSAVGLLSDWFEITLPPRGPGNGPVAIRPDGVVPSTPDAAAFRGQERLDVVVRGTDGFYWTSSGTGATWSPWRGLGAPPGGASGDPAVVSWAPGRLDVFVRGTDTRLWQTFSENGGATWSPWIKPFGDDGVLASSPEASSRAPGQLDILVVGTDNQIYQRFYEGAWNDRWLGQGRPSAGIKGDPGTASQDGSRLDLFVQGGDDKLWQRSWNGSAWSAWFQPVGSSGTLASSPEAISWGAGNLLVFIRGTDSGIYALLFNNGFWDPWKRLVGEGDVTPSPPGAISRGRDRWDVFVRGIDNRVYQIWV